MRKSSLKSPKITMSYLFFLQGPLRKARPTKTQTTTHYQKNNASKTCSNHLTAIQTEGHLRQIIFSQLNFLASTAKEGSMTPPRRRSTRCNVDSWGPVCWLSLGAWRKFVCFVWFVSLHLTIHVWFVLCVVRQNKCRSKMWCTYVYGKIFSCWFVWVGHGLVCCNYRVMMSYEESEIKFKIITMCCRLFSVWFSVWLLGCGFERLWYLDTSSMVNNYCILLLVDPWRPSVALPKSVTSFTNQLQLLKQWRPSALSLTPLSGKTETPPKKQQAWNHWKCPWKGVTWTVLIIFNYTNSSFTLWLRSGSCACRISLRFFVGFWDVPSPRWACWRILEESTRELSRNKPWRPPYTRAWQHHHPNRQTGTIKQSYYEQTNKRTNERTNEQTNQPTNEPTNQPTNQPINKQTKQTNKQTYSCAHTCQKIIQRKQTPTIWLSFWML